MGSDKRAQIRAQNERDRTNRIKAETAGVKTALSLTEGLLAINQDLLAEFRSDAMEHKKCPRRIAALERASTSKDAEIAQLKAELLSEKLSKEHWQRQNALKSKELGDLQQEIGPLRNDDKSAAIARLNSKLLQTQTELTAARVRIAELEAP